MDNTEEIKEKVAEIVVNQQGCEPSEVTDDASFTQDLGMDSLDQVEAIMEMEKEFNISIADEVAEKINTVQDAVEAIKSLLRV